MMSDQLDERDPGSVDWPCLPESQVLGRQGMADDVRHFSAIRIYRALRDRGVAPADARAATIDLLQLAERTAARIRASAIAMAAGELAQEAPGT